MSKPRRGGKKRCKSVADTLATVDSRLKRDAAAQLPSIAATAPPVYNQTRTSGSSSVVERDLAKVDVAGSTPVSRSRS
jgi:hypothetical protein